MKDLKFLVVASTIALAACGGGGGGGGSSSPAMPPAPVSGVPTASPTPTGIPGPTATPTPTLAPTPSPTPAPAAIGGKIVSIPAGAYGASAPQVPLAGAVVIVGPTLILGATPPPTLPAGDVQATTDASGNYSVTIAAAQVSPDASPNALFVIPGQNLSGVTPPTRGYYISVFATGADGKSPNAPLPVHAFSAVVANGVATQRVTTATVDEAANLAYLNAARVKANPAAPMLTFDESAQEVAREHAQDEAANKYYCHYDRANVGPESRYLRMLGLGSDGENWGIAGGSSQSAYSAIINLFMSEGPGGGHYDNIVGSTRLWAGVTTAIEADGLTQHTDDELIVPHTTVQFIYGTSSGCPSGTVANNS